MRSGDCAALRVNVSAMANVRKEVILIADTYHAAAEALPRSNSRRKQYQRLLHRSADNYRRNAEVLKRVVFPQSNIRFPVSGLFARRLDDTARLYPCRH